MTPKEDILVSIITVCYNSSKTVEDTIASVLSQTYPQWEHIIIDGGSSDNTIAIFKKHENAYNGRLRIYQGPDKGIYDAMNKGIEKAKGIIIGIINSDDWYAPDALEKVVGAYQNQHHEEAIITGGLNRVRDGVIIYNQKHSEITLNALKKGMPLQHPAVFVSKKVYERIGTFDLTFPHIADYDFIWRCYEDGNISFFFVDSVVSFMREGGASDCLSWKHIKSRAVERYRLRKKYLSKREAFCSSAFFFIKEYCFQITKKVIGTENIRKVYNLKHHAKA